MKNLIAFQFYNDTPNPFFLKKKKKEEDKGGPISILSYHVKFKCLMGLRIEWTKFMESTTGQLIVIESWTPLFYGGFGTTGFFSLFLLFYYCCFFKSWKMINSPIQGSFRPTHYFILFKKKIRDKNDLYFLHPNTMHLNTLIPLLLFLSKKTKNYLTFLFFLFSFSLLF